MSIFVYGWDIQIFRIINTEIIVLHCVLLCRNNRFGAYFEADSKRYTLTDILLQKKEIMCHSHLVSVADENEIQYTF